MLFNVKSKNDRLNFIIHMKLIIKLFNLLNHIENKKNNRFLIRY